MPAPMGFPDGSVIKNLPAKARDTGSILVSERSPGEGIPLDFAGTNTEVLLPGKSHGQRSLVEIPWTEEPGGLQSMQSEKCWTQRSDSTTTTNNKPY